MPAKNKPDSNIQDILIVDKFQDIRLIFSEKHNMILNLVLEKEMSVSDIARELAINPGSAYYHLKELEKHGLVRQVREEIKGGVVRKYYRATAKRILLESPNFNRHKETASFPTQDYLERLIGSIEYLGYHLSPDNKEDATDLLIRYDRRIKSLLIELQNSGLDDVENNGFVMDTAYQLILNIKAKNDPELQRLYEEFEKLFLKYQ